MRANMLHFGAGALGRGLVLPRITAAGGAVSVADTDQALVDHIRKLGHYRLVIAGDNGRREVDVPISAAYAIGRDDAALDAAIAKADFVTTSVQVGNLPRVVARLVGVWKGAAPRPRMVVGSENLRHVGRHLASLFAAHDGVDGISTPDCVVDRISAALPEGLVAETEEYSEWVVEAPAECGMPGPDFADDVDRLFFRKRYLVNSLADAAAFLGLAKGKIYLHEAMRDQGILEHLAPLLDLLRMHLTREFGFEADDLLAYQARSVARLSNQGISRRLDTVARDPWRKFAPTERFLEPIIVEAGRGTDVSAALKAFAAVVAAAEPDAGVRRTQLDAIWADSAAEQFAARIAASEPT